MACVDEVPRLTRRDALTRRGSLSSQCIPKLPIQLINYNRIPA